MTSAFSGKTHTGRQFNIDIDDAKIGSQETPGVTGKFGLGIRNEAGQRLIEFCQENALGIAKTQNTKTQEKTLHIDITRWSTLKSD